MLIVADGVDVAEPELTVVGVTSVVPVEVVPVLALPVAVALSVPAGAPLQAATKIQASAALRRTQMP